MIRTEASPAATRPDPDPRPLGQAATGNGSASVTKETIQPTAGQSAGRLNCGSYIPCSRRGLLPHRRENPAQLRHQLALTGRLAEKEDLLRAANLLQLKSRLIGRVDAKRLGSIQYPAIMELKDGGFAVLAVSTDKGRIRLIDPIARSAKEVSLEKLSSSGFVILVTRRLGGAGTDPNSFGFRWFWPSILRYRRPLAHVLVASQNVKGFEYIDTAVALDPNFAPAYAIRAWLKYQKIWLYGLPWATQLKEFESDLRLALALDPSFYSAHAGLIQYLADMGQWTELSAEIDRAVRDHPRNTVVLREAATQLSALGRPEEGVAMADLVLRLDPQMPRS